MTDFESKDEPARETASEVVGGLAILAGVGMVAAFLLAIWLESAKWAQTGGLLGAVAFVLTVIAVLVS